MFNDTIYRFCSPDQLAIAGKAHIINFISNHKNIADSLMQLTKETSQFFSIHMDGAFDLRNVSAAMSYILEHSAHQDLKSKFTEHVLQQQNDHTVAECLNALGPLMVGMAFKTSVEHNV